MAMKSKLYPTLICFKLVIMCGLLKKSFYKLEVHPSSYGDTFADTLWAYLSDIFHLKPCILFRYVRIGNGNQLVRDPKKRIRVLASEKVRWSLRTARLRLARKRRYCQFFTRFGKCNKEDGKCPYIHDPSKIVVCTKFLTGSCTNINCKLTHKVISDFCLMVIGVCYSVFFIR